MRIEERITGRDTSDLCEIAIDTIKTLQSSLEAVIIETSTDTSASKQVKDHMFNQLVKDGWRPRFKIDKNVTDLYPLANYVLDAMQDIPAESCNHLHRFFVEFCFDNRQAIGSNILKFEVASRGALEASFMPVPILICADSDALKHFGWDSSIASANEYEYALRVVYRNIINHPAIILALRN
jgi:hypothetical protein